MRGDPGFHETAVVNVWPEDRARGFHVSGEDCWCEPVPADMKLEDFPLMLESWTHRPLTDMEFRTIPPWIRAMLDWKGK